MRKILSFILMCVISISGVAKNTQEELTPFSMKVFAQTFKPVKAKANGTIKLQKCSLAEDKALDLWCYNVDTKIRIAEVHQLSKFTFAEGQIKPWYMQQDDRAFWKKTHQSAKFDQTNNKIRSEYKKTTQSQTYEPGVLDDVSYALQIQQLLLQDKKEFSLRVLAGHEIKTMNFKVLGKESIFTKAGILETLKVERIAGNSKVHIWFAKRWDYLPIKFETFRSNKLYSRVTITSIDI